jgi:hypothetical protein
MGRGLWTRLAGSRDTGVMAKSVEGIYRNGKVELLQPLEEAEGSRVIVTPVQPNLSAFANGASTSLRRPICAIDWPGSPRIGIGQKWAPTMNFRRGDIVLVFYPDSNQRTAKRRPALIVQADRLGTGLPQTIVAMITSQHGPCRTPEQSVGATER